MAKANVMGNLPHEIEHHQPLRMRAEEIMPATVQRHLTMSLQEQEEADYCIVTPVDKKDIVIMQLEDLVNNNKFDDPKDNMQWKEYEFERDDLDKLGLLKCGPCRGRESYMKKKKLTAIAITFPMAVLNGSAVKNELDATLT